MGSWSIASLKDRALDRLALSVARRARAEIAAGLLTQIRIYGSPDRLHIADSAVVNNALFNLASGEIHIGEFAMLAHDTSLLTGTHDVSRFGPDRQSAVPVSGRDIVVEEGAWLASNVTVLGPCRIGRHAVVAAGSLVRDDVPPYAVAAGIPARVVGHVPGP